LSSRNELEERVGIECLEFWKSLAGELEQSSLGRGSKLLYRFHSPSRQPI
jgi:hypothetical protein